MSRHDLADHRRALHRLPRRALLSGGLSMGALSLLTGCNLEDDDVVDRLLSAMSRWNDSVQAALFSRSRLAPTYAEADITNPSRSMPITRSTRCAASMAQAGGWSFPARSTSAGPGR